MNDNDMAIRQWEVAKKENHETEPAKDAKPLPIPVLRNKIEARDRARHIQTHDVLKGQCFEGRMTGPRKNDIKMLEDWGRGWMGI